MKYRMIPGTSLRVSEVGFPVWTLGAGWWGQMESSKAHHLLQYAVDRGINFFDTADVYGSGQNESLIGDAIHKERDRVVLATKFGYVANEENVLSQDFSEDHIRFACEKSLKRLRTDHIDLYQIHHPHSSTIAHDELYATLESLRKQGKIITWGASLIPSHEALQEGRALIQTHKAPCIQLVYNLLEQELGRSLLESAKETVFLVRMPHSRGLLDGKWSVDAITESEWDPYHLRSRDWQIQGLKKVEKLDFLVQSGKRTLAQAALKFVLRQASVVSVFPEIYGESDINDYSGVSECANLTEDELQKIARLYENNFQTSKTDSATAGQNSNS
jgi:aryl-alcohol dehydrogenase-like predicted oxidoreductase